MKPVEFFDSMSGKSAAEAKETMINLFSSMSPERFSEHMYNLRESARLSGKNGEQDEIVCRLLATGMSVEEIAVILCIRAEAVRAIESNNATTKIPEYIKTLKERRKRREKQAK